MLYGVYAKGGCEQRRLIEDRDEGFCEKRERKGIRVEVKDGTVGDQATRFVCR